ncbi:MAG TPA: hypothetical protein VFH48_27590 [Chloroflexota bacterium]|nr:hypothetical protein [Chloroflexota bacterium]
MSRPIARSLAAVAIATAVLVSPSVVLAAHPNGSPALHLAKKRVDTLIGLSRELQTSAVHKARSRPGAPTLTGQGGTSQSGPSDLELDLICGDDWFITWDEDANGNPISGTFHLHCGGTDILIG